jgi:hypothetical protein
MIFFIILLLKTDSEEVVTADDPVADVIVDVPVADELIVFPWLLLNKALYIVGSILNC